MTDEEYLEFKRRYTPPHLTAKGCKPINRFQELEDAAKAATIEQASKLDRLVDHAYKRFGIGSDQLAATIYAVAFRKRYGAWPEAGADFQAVDHASLDKLHEATLRVIYSPEVIGGDERTKTIYDYSGFDSDGRPERFSAFVNRQMDNRYRGTRKKAFRDKNREIGIQCDIDDDSPPAPGFMMEYQLGDAAAVPKEGVLYDKVLPGELAYRISELNITFRQDHAAIAHAFLDLNITSAAEIARMVKCGELSFWSEMRDRKTPKDKEAISKIVKDYKRRVLDAIEGYVREYRDRVIEAFPELAPGALDDASIEREMKRIVGLISRKPNPVGFKKAKRTKEQQLSFDTYAIAGRHSDG